MFVALLACIHCYQSEYRFSLSLFKVKELKEVAKEIERRVRIASIRDPSTPWYHKPTCAARKAEWVTSISNALGSNNILNIIDPQVAAAAVPPLVQQSASNNVSVSPRRMREIAAAARSSIPTSASSYNAAATASAYRGITYDSVAAAKSNMNITPSKRKSNCATKMSAAEVQTQSPCKLAISSPSTKKFSKHSKTNSAKKPSAKTPPPTKTNNSTIGLDEIVAERLQSQYYNESCAGIEKNYASISSAAPIVAAPYYHKSNRMNNTNSNTTKMNQSSAKSKDHSKVKVKTEPKSPTLLPDNSLQPKDYRESSMVESLRNMGFTDVREMLSGIRATSTNDTSLFIPNQWNQQQQVEAAMMWIVNQREEVAEARKLDEARVSSEMADRAMECSRREERERQMKYADLNALFGSMEEDSIVSKYFPESTLLKNAEVRKVMHAIGIGPGKDVSIKLLHLEAKARKWYGTVLPYAHFRYVICPLFETWTREFIVSSKRLNSASTSILIQKVSHEYKQLEQGMYNLSEQEQGSFGLAPKLFLKAKKDAERKGLSVCDMTSNDGDVTFVPSYSTCSHTSPAKKSISSTIEVIEIS